MKCPFISAALLAILSSTVVLGQGVQESPDGKVGVPAPNPVVVNENVVVTVTVTPQPVVVNNKAAVPQGPPAIQEKVFNPNPASPSASPTNYNPPPPNPSGGSNPTSGKVCINFSGDDFHWANAGSWGTAKGQGAKDASQCFDSVPGGAMFICEGPCDAAGDAAPAKYTKLECNFEGQYQNCDISLVDGYSLPLQCDIPNANPPRIGGLTDLASLETCESPVGDNTCNNTQGYSASTNQVSRFFQNANWPDGGQEGPAGNYCIWQFCSGKSDAFWTGKPTISCRVGKRHKKRSLDIGGQEIKIEARSAELDIETVNARHAKRHIGGAHSHAAAHLKN